MADFSSEGTIQLLLQRAGSGDESAINELLRHSCERLTRLAHTMLHGFPGVRRWAETDDVLQNALLRLNGALRDLKPRSAREFLALATLQIRRELIDLARRFYGPHGIGANHDSQATVAASPGLPEKSDLTHEPSSLAQWAELHEQIGKLPEAERDVVELLFYQGLPQAEAAEILGVSVRTLQRSWHSALWKLHQVWKGEFPKP